MRGIISKESRLIVSFGFFWFFMLIGTGCNLSYKGDLNCNTDKDCPAGNICNEEHICVASGHTEDAFEEKEDITGQDLVDIKGKDVITTEDIHEEVCTKKSCNELNFECGKANDGCGNIIDCGTCPDKKECVDHKCVNPFCGDHKCNGDDDCTTCPDDCKCGNGQKCYKGICCTPNCFGKSCGDDGCGGSCGTCPDDYVCDNDQCKPIIKVVNKVTTNSNIISTPAIDKNGDIYFTGVTIEKIENDDQHNKLEYHLYKISKNGSIIWNKVLSSVTKESTYLSGIYTIPSPVIDYKHNAIYVTTIFGGLHSFNLDATGSKNWDISLCYRLIDSTPAIGKDGNIYVGCYDRTLYVIDPNKGKKVGNINISDKIDTSPLIGPDGTVYFGDHNGKLYAVVAEFLSGSIILKKKWEFNANLPNERKWILSSPAMAGCNPADSGTYTNCQIYFGSNNGFVFALDSDGNQKWRFDTGGPVVSSPAVVNTNDVNGQLFIVIGSKNGLLYILNNSGKEECSYRTNGPIVSSPAVGKSGIYFGSNDGNIYSIDFACNLRKKIPTGGPVNTSPTIDSKLHRVYIGSSDGYLYIISDPEAELLKGKGNWPKFHRDLANTGRFLAPDISSDGGN